MNSVRWRTLLRNGFSFAAVSVLLFGAMTAAATDEVVIAPPDKGTLILKTGAHGKLEFRWDQPQVGESDPPDIVQKIIDKSWVTRKYSDICTLKLLESTPTPGGLVTLAATGGVPGVAFDHVGVKGRGWCSEISGHESLTLSLSGLLAGYQVYRTELNFDMDPNAVVKIVTRFGDSEPQTSIIRTGAEYPGSELCVFEATPERDICRWQSDAIWDSATITVLRSNASIEGGSGGGGEAHFSRFSLTEFNATLPCAPETGELPIGVTVVDNPDDPQATATVTRLKNSVPEEQCKPLQVAIEWDGPKSLQFFSADQGQSVVSTFTIAWPIEDAPNAGDTVLDSIPLSKQTFQQQDGFIESDLDLCRGTPTGYVPDPDPTRPGEFLITGLLVDEGVADQSDLFGFQYGCVYEQRVTFPADGKIYVKQWIYLSGDWGANRR